MADGEKSREERASDDRRVYQRRHNSRKIIKRKRHRTRRFRRQRSKIRYYRRLRQGRERRRSKELCDAVAVFDVTDMEWAPVAASLSDASLDVAEWQHQEQVNYWKSRAVSLEYENRMLHQLIRDFHAKHLGERRDNTGEGHVTCPRPPFPGEKSKKDARKAAKSPEEADRTKLPPDVQRKNRKRLEEMEKLYGKNAQKVTGMETAVQLTYELQVDQSSPPFWPNLPLRL